ncbi:MAG: zinc-ribbon domain-containing protein [Lachnospiraceae bacterium]
MEEFVNEGQTNSNSRKAVFTVKNILRVLGLLCIIFAFCPAFLVSCAGEKMNVTVMTAVEGVSMYGEKVVKPHPIMIVCILIPIAVLVLLFLNKLSEKKTAAIISGICAADVVVWLIFRATVKNIAEENYLSFETTAWYFINLIALILIIILSVLGIMKKVRLDADLLEHVSNENVQGKLEQVTNVVNQVSGQMSAMVSNAASSVSNKKKLIDAIGYCTRCGSPIEYGVKFCTSCGAPVPEDLIAEAEEKRKAEEQARQDAEEQKEAEAQQKAEAQQPEENVQPETKETEK